MSSTVQTASDSTRIFGMGVGTFIVFIMTVSLIIAWVFSAPCRRPVKLVTRWCSTLIFGLTIILLIFAERRDAFRNLDIAEKTYDEGMPGRIAVSLFMACSTIASIIILIFGPASDTMKATTHDRETNYLWVN